MIRAVLGGSFDPVHDGHVAMAAAVLQAGLADVVHVVPAWRSPHKDDCSAPPAHRLAMARLAFPPTRRLLVDPREITGGRPVFTVETLTALHDEHGDDPWRLVIGADNLAGFRSWHQPERLLELAELVVLGRRGWEISPDAVRAAGLAPERVIGLPDFAQPVSSTAVRAMLAGGPRAVPALVAGGIPIAVARHIVRHQLYRPDRNGETRVPDPD